MAVKFNMSGREREKTKGRKGKRERGKREKNA